MCLQNKLQGTNFFLLEEDQDTGLGAVPILVFSETGRRETGKRKWKRKGGRETERKEVREEREREEREKEVGKERGSKEGRKNHSISQTLPDFEDQPKDQLRSVFLEAHFFTQV